MRAWIYALLNLFPSYLRSPAQWVADRIYGVYDDSVRFSKWIRSGWAELFPKVTYFAWRLRGFVIETYNTLWWIVFEFIPLHIYFASVNVTNFVLAHLDAIKQFLWDHISNVISWAQTLIDELRGKLFNLIIWSTERVAELWNTLIKVRDLVWLLLTDPRKLASWLVGAMIDEILKYIYSNRTVIANWFMLNAPALTLAISRELARLIGRVL